MPGEAITITSGDTVNIEDTITDSAGAAVDLTGASSTFVIYGSGSALVTKTSGAGDITYGGAGTSVATVALAPADTASLEGVYRYELQVTDSSGSVSTVSANTIYINGDLIT